MGKGQFSAQPGTEIFCPLFHESLLCFNSSTFIVKMMRTSRGPGLLKAIPPPWRQQPVWGLLWRRAWCSSFFCLGDFGMIRYRWFWNAKTMVYFSGILIRAEEVMWVKIIWHTFIWQKNVLDQLFLEWFEHHLNCMFQIIVSNQKFPCSHSKIHNVSRMNEQCVSMCAM